MSQPLDYKELLKKYMTLVCECESFSYLVHASTVPNGDFTDADVEELERIWKEVTE